MILFFLCFPYFAVPHAINYPLYGVRLDEVPCCVQGNTPVTELGIVPDFCRVDYDVVPVNVIVLDELEEGLDSVPRTKVVGSTNVGPQNLFCLILTVT